MVNQEEDKVLKERVREIRISLEENDGHSYLIKVGPTGRSSHIFKDGKELENLEEATLELKAGQVSKLILKENLMRLI